MWELSLEINLYYIKRLTNSAASGRKASDPFVLGALPMKREGRHEEVGASR